MSDIDHSLEQLLRQSPPRAVPDPADAAAARTAVHSEWRAVAGKYRSQRNLLRFAVAATVLIGVFSIFNQFRGPEPSDVKVASIQKSFGSIHVLGQTSQSTLANDLATIHVGQTIVTGDDAGIALAWALGGGLRLDEKTKLEFKDDNTVYLHNGQIYFDSAPTGASLAEGFAIETDYGSVSHLGTQFMTQVLADELKVSVREGQVHIAGQFHNYSATPGEQAVFRARRRPEVLSIPGYGTAWDWIGRSSPGLDFEGKSTHDFLQWVGRELGREIEYSSSAVEAEARDAMLRDDIDAPPAEALRLRMATSGIDWHYDGGKIYVGKSE